MQNNYYADKLNSQKLFQVYETNIPRVKQYLDAEIDYVRSFLSGHETVLELGAGYGRIVRELAPACASIVGIDISRDNVELGNAYLKGAANAELITMDIHNITLKSVFNVVLCLQNGLSSMRATTQTITNIMGLVAPGGRAFFSSYSENFWDYRLQWFQEQAAKKLLGEIDMEQTKDNVIVCKDGFRATTHSPERFEEIGGALGYPYRIQEVDDSSLFLIVEKP